MAINVWVKDPEALRKHSTTYIVGGVVLAAFGIVMLIRPDVSGTVLVRLIGACLLVCGLVLVYGSWKPRAGRGGAWIAALAPSIALTIFGLVVILWPNAVGQVLLVVVALLAIAAGLGDIVSSFSILAILTGWWVGLIRGILLTAAGIWLLAGNVSGLAALGTFLGIWALLIGFFTTAFGIVSRRV